MINIGDVGDKMNFLVLGGNGYIGSKVVHSLLAIGHTVVCTRREKSDLRRVEDVKDKVVWIKASVDAIEAAMQYTTFDYILNMACNYGRENVLYDNVLEANIEFPLNVLNKAVEHGTKRFLTLGTGLPEDFNMYSFSKKMYSSFGKFYVDKHDIDFTVLKLEMFYGSDEPNDRFLPSVIRKMIDGDAVETTIGTQRRDIIASDDIVKAIMMVIDSNLSGYNEISVGTGVSPKLSEIIDYIWLETGKRSEVIKGAVPMRKDEPDCVADVSMLKSLGEWSPKYWKNGIKQMIQEMGGKSE